MLALVVAILCVNLKVPGRTSQESHENPNVCSCLQIPPLGKSFKLGGEVSWEDPWQCGFAGKSGGWGLSCRGGGSDVWGRQESSAGFVISFDFEQKITEEALGGEEG